MQSLGTQQRALSGYLFFLLAFFLPFLLGIALRLRHRSYINLPTAARN